uniref:Synaptonemal complex central element protein 2 n=1 Tax=Sciurus vulgaris TaxID=55149 RepID=A0A8D2DCZ4_SCIVU
SPNFSNIFDPWDESLDVTDLTEKLEERMYQVYNHHSKIIQERLQEFTQKMTKISNLETELKQVCHTVESVYKDLCVQPEPSLRRGLDHSTARSPPCPTIQSPQPVNLSHEKLPKYFAAVTSKLGVRCAGSLFSSPSFCSSVPHK